MKKSMNHLARYLLILAVALFVGSSILPGTSFAYINDNHDIFEIGNKYTFSAIHNQGTIALWDERNRDRIARNENGLIHWGWLRSPRQRENMTATISTEGDINIQGTWGFRGGVRPAIWLYLETLN